MRHYGFLVILFLLPFTGFSQEVLPLYTGNIPGAISGQLHSPKPGPGSGTVYEVLEPQLELYLPEAGHQNGTAIVICPGGSYKVLTYEAEGRRTAKEFQKNGITAMILKYRLPNDTVMTNKQIRPLQDAQQAIKVVRENATKWHIDPAKIGLMGFSAGGHVASTAATHFKTDYIDNPQHTNLRPDFLVLVYPVISMCDSLTHKPSRTNLLGKAPPAKDIRFFSNELQANEDTPPTYLTHAADDKTVDVDNSIAFFEKLRHSGVPAELHIFPKGGHGFVLKQPSAEWMAPLFCG